ELGFASAVEAWHCADICDLSAFPEESFDAVVAYGGPFSYVLDKRDQALAECVRVTRPSGLILMSVMSLWGTVHAFLPGVLEVPRESNRRILQSGDLVPETLPGYRHSCHMYRAAELRAFVEKAGLQLLDISASNSLSSVWKEELSAIRQNPG